MTLCSYGVFEFIRMVDNKIETVLELQARLRSVRVGGSLEISVYEVM